MVESSGIGARHAVRYLDDDGRLTDLTGELLARGNGRVELLPDDAPPRTIQAERISAMRQIPPRPVRPTSSIDKLQRLAARGWPGLEVQRLGGWLLRAGGGFTRRANSCLPLGDPGMPIPQAIDQARRFYADRQLPCAFQIPLPPADPVDTSVLQGELDDWGRDDPTLFMVADLRKLTLTDAVPGFECSQQPSTAWFETYHYRGQELPELGRQVITAAPAWYGTIQAGGRIAAIGRLAVTDDWVGLSAVEVGHDLRRRGLGRAITIALLRLGAESGARFAYLQVVADNAPAVALYQSLGFLPHHHYHYRQQDPR